MSLYHAWHTKAEGEPCKCELCGTELTLENGYADCPEAAPTPFCDVCGTNVLALKIHMLTGNCPGKAT